MNTDTTTKTDPLLVEAIRYIARQCDGAQSDDGIGFNGTDTHFGHALASVPADAWAPDVARAAWEMLAKYRGQLSGGGIDYDAIQEPPLLNYAAPSKRIRIVDYDTDVGIIVRIPYGDHADPKNALKARWDKPNKRWIVSASRFDRVMDYAEETGLTVSDTAREFLTNAEFTDEGIPIGTVEIENGEFVIQFDYDPDAVAAVRDISGRAWNAARKVWTAPLTSVRAVREFAHEHSLTLSPSAEAVPDAEPVTGPEIQVIGGEFALKFDYDRDLVARCRDLPSARWNARLRAWTVDLEASIEVADFAIATEARIHATAADVLAGAQEALERIEQSAATDADLTIPNLGGELLPFQRAGVLYTLKAMGLSPNEHGRWV